MNTKGKEMAGKKILTIRKNISNKKKEESMSMKWKKTTKEESKKNTFCRKRKIGDQEKKENEPRKDRGCDESHANELEGIRNWGLNEGEGDTKSSKRL
jgi:hypothetical protein